VDGLSPEDRSENMRRIRSTHTTPELLVRRMIHGMGFRYRLHVRELPGTPDIVLTRLRSIVEVRGCFWHQHGRCADSHIPKTRRDYWVPKLKRNRIRDRKNAAKLRKLGWRLLVVWECEIRDPPKLFIRLSRFLNL
jgi:DNA mismatch endonuclease, patch repair protein